MIGCGRIGSLFDRDPKRKNVSTHAGAYVNHPKTQLLSVCDIDEKKLQMCAYDWEVKFAYKNYNEMLTHHNIDILSICTLNDTHEAILDTAVNNGVKAIFCEKPISDSIQSAKRMIKKCRDNNVILAVNHFRRWDKFYKNIKTMINSGILGNIQQVIFYYTRGIANSGAHLFDLLRFYFGDIKAVNSYQEILDYGNDPTISAYIEMESGLFCNLIACNGEYFRIFDLDIIGSKGRLIIDNSKNVKFYKAKPSKRSSEFDELHEENNLDFIASSGDYFLEAVSDIVNSIETGKELCCKGEDGLRSLEAIIGTLKSSELNQKLCFPLVEFAEEAISTK